MSVVELYPRNSVSSLSSRSGSITKFPAKSRATLSLEVKLGEMEFFLKMMEAESEAGFMKLDQGCQLEELGIHHNQINYFFSGFSNALQSVKDILHAITQSAPWDEFATINNFLFIKNARNAITIDGLQLINSCCGMRYSIAHAEGSLKCCDVNGDEVEILFPSENILTVCKQFYADLLGRVKEIVEANPLPFEVGENGVFGEVLLSPYGNSTLPDVVRDIVRGNPVLLNEARGAMGEHSSSTLLADIDKRISRLALEGE